MGYQFRCGDLRAMWFADNGMIKSYGADGTLVRKIDPQEQMKKAA